MYFTLTDIKICVAPMTEIFMLYYSLQVTILEPPKCVKWRHMNKQTKERRNERMNERTENLPIIQDFVPYRGRCPKSTDKLIILTVKGVNLSYGTLGG